MILKCEVLALLGLLNCEVASISRVALILLSAYGCFTDALQINQFKSIETDLQMTFTESLRTVIVFFLFVRKLIGGSTWAQRVMVYAGDSGSFASICVHLCPFVSICVCLCPFMSFYVCLCPFMPVYVHLCLFKSICVCLCPFMSFYVCLCPLMPVYVHLCSSILCPFLFNQ